MSLRQTSSISLHSDKEYAQRAAKDYMEFIMTNLKQLDNLKNGKKLKEDAISLSKVEGNYTDPQLSYIDVLYEKIMKGFGLPSFSATYKPKKRFI